MNYCFFSGKSYSGTSPTFAREIAFAASKVANAFARLKAANSHMLVTMDVQAVMTAVMTV